MPTGLCGAGSPGFRLGRVESPMRTTVVFGPARPGTPVGHAQTSWSTTARPEILAGSPLGERGSPGVEPHCKSEGAGFSGPYRLCRICSPLSPRPQVGESVLLKAARVAGVNKSGTASPATGVEPRLPTWGAGGSPPGSRGAEGVELWLPRGVEPGILGWSRAGLGSPWGARLHPKMPGSTGSTPGEPRRLRGAAAPFGEPRLPTEGSRPEFLGERGRWAAADEAPLRG